MLPPEQDAFGHMMMDHLQGREAREIVERDDGLFDVSLGPALYFSTCETWPAAERAVLEHARGRVLDVGCGAGRHSLHLQEKGCRVLALDRSPLALKVCRRRGVKRTTLLPVTRISRRLGEFDTVLMLGNNLALLGTPRRAVWLLRRLAGMTSPEARILAQSRDPYQTEEPEHLAYHARNRRKGRPGGQARIRVRYRRTATPWMDFLMLSPQELAGILEATPWRITETHEEGQGLYYVVLRKPTR